MNAVNTAILIDGGFYLKRARALWGEKLPADRAKELFTYCLKHLNSNHEERSLYRIFYYDCPPATKRVFHPLLKKTVDLSKTDLYRWANEFHNCLKGKRKMALRFGVLNENGLNYNLLPEITKKLCRDEISIRDLKESDFKLSVEQKGVDMRLGLDISSMAHKHLVGQMILISGDSDFIPVAKHARREGIDFILDPMWTKVKPELEEHVDGVCTPAVRPQLIKTEPED